MDRNDIQRLIRQVITRMRLAGLGHRFYFFMIVSALIYVSILLVSRFSGLIPNLFEPVTVLTVPLLAVALSILFHARPADHEAARLIDRQAKTKDLFLTALSLDSAPGEYQPLVNQQAADQAKQIKPKDVVPFNWTKRFRDLTGITAVLILVAMFLPQFDPFGSVEARERDTKRKQQLVETAKSTKKRIELLKQKELDAENSKEVDQSIQQLKLTFNQMKPGDQRFNHKRLSEEQKRLGEQWRRLSEKQLADALKQSDSDQQFGGDFTKPGESEQWRKDLKQGKTDSLKKKMDDIRRKMQQMEKAQQSGDAAESQRIAQQIRDELNAVSDFLQRNANNPALSQALKQALEQLDMSQMNSSMSEQAMQNLQESMDLSELELEQLAQSLRDMESLQEALKTLQSAKAANSQKSLDGKQCGACQSLSDYEAMYRQMMAQAGGGQGQGGMRGPGTGKGGVAPENPDQATDYQSERTKSAMTAGKILMQWKSRGVSSAGEAVKDFRSSVADVKQGVSEAILQEQIPAGYHDSIKQYFDTIEQSVPADNSTTPNSVP